MSRLPGAAARLCALALILPIPLSAAETPLLWAEFKDALQSHSGAVVQPIAMSERAGDAAVDPLRVADAAVHAEGRLSRDNGSQWATLGFEVGADAKGLPVNLAGYDSIRIRLSASTPRVLRVRLKGQDPATLNAGCYPVMMQRVGTQATDYVIPLSAFGPEPYCGDRGRSVEQTLPAVAWIEVTANEPSPDPVRFAMGRVEFLPAAAAAAVRETRPANVSPPPATGARDARDAAKKPTRKPAADAPASPPAQPTRQVTCERNNKYGLMMCY